MNHDPEKIVYENLQDLVDYVSRGPIPKKEHFTNFIDAVAVEHQEESGDSTLVIGENVLNVSDKPIVADVLKRVYENRVSNRKNLCIGGVVTLVALSLVKYLFSKK